MKFEYKIKSFKSKELTLEIIFKTPELVSQTQQEAEDLRVIFWGSAWFVDKKFNEQVNGGPSLRRNNVLILNIPPQRGPKKIELSTAEVAAVDTGSVALGIGTVAGNFVLSASLNSLWSMINTQQMIVLIPLFQVDLPENAGMVFKQMMKIAAFDLVPNTEDIYNTVLGIDELPGPLTENFGTVGFETTYFIHNMGSLVFFIVAFPLMSIVAFLFTFCRQYAAIRKAKKSIEETIYWNYLIRLLIESYTILAVCGMINLTDLKWDSVGTFIVSVNAILFLVVCVALPFG